MADSSARPRHFAPDPDDAPPKPALVRDMQDNPLAVAILLLAVAILVGLSIHALLARTAAARVQEIRYRKLSIAEHMTSQRCATLNRAQILGHKPIMRGHNAITLRDLLLSMRDDMEEHGFEAIGAMHYDKPLCVVTISLQHGAESDNALEHEYEPGESVPGPRTTIPTVMYNMHLTGWVAEKVIDEETDVLCKNGSVTYNAERFTSVWVRYRGEDGRVYDRWLDGHNARLAQHMFMLNQGELPCTEITVERIMRIARAASKMQMAPANAELAYDYDEM